MIKSILSIAIAFLFSLQIFGQEAANTIKLNYSQEEFKKAKESLSFTFEVSSEELGKKMLENTEKFYLEYFKINMANDKLFYTSLNSNPNSSLTFYRLLVTSEIKLIIIGEKTISVEQFFNEYLK